MEYSSVQYKYGLSKNGAFVDVSQLTQRDRTEYECIGCGHTIIPIMGENRRKHFRHKINSECSFETYLHKLAKKVFISQYRNCIQTKQPFFITINQEISCETCSEDLNLQCTKTRDIKYDLTEYYDIINEEVRDEKFIPDILLSKTNGTDKVYIEFFVSHKSDFKKISSGIKIIEIKIEDEGDVYMTTCHHLDHKNTKTSFFNFKKKVAIKIDKRSYDCFGDKFDWFILFADKSSRLQPFTVSEFFNKNNTKIIYFKRIPYVGCNFKTRKKMHGQLIIEAIKLGHDIPLTNCPICNRKLNADIMINDLWCSWCGKPLKEFIK